MTISWWNFFIQLNQVPLLHIWLDAPESLTHAAATDAPVSAVAFWASQIRSRSPAVASEADAVAVLTLFYWSRAHLKWMQSALRCSVRPPRYHVSSLFLVVYVSLWVCFLFPHAFAVRFSMFQYMHSSFWRPVSRPLPRQPPSGSNRCGPSLTVRVPVQTEPVEKWRSGLSINPDCPLRFGSMVTTQPVWIERVVSGSPSRSPSRSIYRFIQGSRICSVLIVSYQHRVFSNHLCAFARWTVCNINTCGICVSPSIYGISA